MTDEDAVAWKLKGFTCYVKFIDGEELPLRVSEAADEEADEEFFISCEDFINQDGNGVNLYVCDVAINRRQVKYIRKI